MQIKLQLILHFALIGAYNGSKVYLNMLSKSLSIILHISVQ